MEKLLKEENTGMRTEKKVTVFAGVLLTLCLVLAIAAHWIAGEPLNAIGSLLPWTVTLLFALIFCAVLWLSVRRGLHTPNGTSKRELVRLAIFVGAALSFSMCAASAYSFVYNVAVHTKDLCTFAGVFGVLFSAATLLRAVVLMPLSVLIVALLLSNAVKTLETVFQNRWKIALSVFVLFVICRINLSSVAAFNWAIQPDLGNSLSHPLFGIARGIRSDEWLVNLPISASTEFAGYGKFNEILRGASNYNLSATGLHLSYAALSDPANLGYFLFGTDMGVSFFWCANAILSVMMALELAYIISGKSRVAALVGVALLAFSPFNLWWSISCLLTGWMAILVATHYCFVFEKFRQRLLCMLGVGLAGAYFICQLYPAWQVPMVYLLVPLFVWLLVKHFDSLKAFRLRDWLGAGAAIALMGSIVVAFLWGSKDYMASIMSTVYPGSRFELGGYALNKPLAFIQTLQFPFRSIAVGSNVCEASAFFSLFPLPILFSIYVLIRQLIERKKDKTQKLDLFNVLLLIPTVFLLIFCTVGFPHWLAKITLMSYSPATRAVDHLGLANTLLLVHHLTASRKYRLPGTLIACLGGALIACSVFSAQRMCPGYLTLGYTLLAGAFTMLLCLACFSELSWKSAKRLLIALSLLLIAVGLTVNPINSGIGALTEKPASKKIQEISQVDPAAKWIGYGNIFHGQYAVANGAPCITSTNYVPNMELWQALDPTGKYNEVYNRYSHITLTFTDEETVFELLGPDHMKLELSYADIEKTGVRYILSTVKLEEESPLVDFRQIYFEGNVYIYEIIYHN